MATGATLINPVNDPNGFTAFFQGGLKRFQDVEALSNNPTGSNGLGPRFNSNSCGSCHAQPAVGGSGAAVNPQFQFVSSGVAPGDTMPGFITANGLTREARFPFFFSSTGGSTPALPTVAWRPCTRSRGAPTPAPAGGHSPTSKRRRRPTTSSSAFPRRSLAQA